MKESKIIFGRWGMTAVLINTICTQIFLNYPRNMSEAGGSAGWILALYVSILVFILFSIIIALYSNFQGKDILDISEYIGGNILRIIIGSIILIDFIFVATVILREFGEDMKVIALTTSPISFVILFLAAGMLFSAYMGIEAVVRLHSITVPIIIVGFFIILIGVSPYYDITNIMPILGSGIYPIFGQGILKVSTFSGLIVLFILAPFVKTYKVFKAAGYSAICISALFLVISSLVYSLVFPYPTTKESIMPIYQLARIINYGRFFQRVESIFVLIWAMAALLYLGGVFFYIIYIFKKTFKLEFHKPLIIPFTILIFNLSLLPPNLMDVANLESEVFRNTAWIVAFMIPLLLLITANIKIWAAKKGGAKK
jgi:spore germination protein (amino acid permease)